MCGQKQAANTPKMNVVSVEEKQMMKSTENVGSAVLD